MKRWGSIFLGVFALAAVLPAWADETSNPLGFYLGGGVGTASVGEGTYSGYYYGCYGYSYGGCDYWHDTGWKVFGGIRPIPFLGAQLEYTNFGNADLNPYATGGLAGDVSAHAASAFALGYLPLPLFLDLYAKAGVSQLWTHDNLYGVGCAAPYQPGGTCTPAAPFFQDRNTTEFGYGGGLQWRFGMFAVRLEYERIGTQARSPDLLSGDFAIVF
jgi:hypothetical protein